MRVKDRPKLYAGEILAELRKTHTKAYLAKKIGISTAAISSYMKGSPVKSSVTHAAILRYWKSPEVPEEGKRWLRIAGVRGKAASKEAEVID
jgi:transcriptional regulator with XRE-family HTH domain